MSHESMYVPARERTRLLREYVRLFLDEEISAHELRRVMALPEKQRNAEMHRVVEKAKLMTVIPL